MDKTIEERQAEFEQAFRAREARRGYADSDLMLAKNEDGYKVMATQVMWVGWMLRDEAESLPTKEKEEMES